MYTRMSEREGWKVPVCTKEQASSHCKQPVHLSGIIRSCFMCLVLSQANCPSMQNIRTLSDEALHEGHSERSEESKAETLRGVYPELWRRAQGDTSGAPILCRLI